MNDSLSGLSHRIRPLLESDMTDLKSIIDSIDLFPFELLDTSDYFDNPETEELWFVFISDNHAVAIMYIVPEKMTSGTYNMLLIGVHKDNQGTGVGSQLTSFAEEHLKAKGARLLLVETSGLPSFELTRAFYSKNNYRAVATLPDFYTEGEDKIVFIKKL